MTCRFSGHRFHRKILEPTSSSKRSLVRAVTMLSTATRRSAVFWDGWLHEKPASAAPRSFIPFMASTFIRVRRRKTGSSGIRWRSLCAAIRTSSSPSRRRIMTLPRQSFPRRWSAFTVLVQTPQSIVICPKPNARRCGASLAMQKTKKSCFVRASCCPTRIRLRQSVRWTY